MTYQLHGTKARYLPFVTTSCRTDGEDIAAGRNMFLKRIFRSPALRATIEHVSGEDNPSTALRTIGYGVLLDVVAWRADQTAKPRNVRHDFSGNESFLLTTATGVR